jgi:hypothetical protein
MDETRTLENINEWGLEIHLSISHSMKSALGGHPNPANGGHLKTGQ